MLKGKIDTSVSYVKSSADDASVTVVLSDRLARIADKIRSSISGAMQKQDNAFFCEAFPLLGDAIQERDGSEIYRGFWTRCGYNTTSGHVAEFRYLCKRSEFNGENATQLLEAYLWRTDRKDVAHASILNAIHQWYASEAEKQYRFDNGMAKPRSGNRRTGKRAKKAVAEKATLPIASAVSGTAEDSKVPHALLTWQTSCSSALTKAWESKVPRMELEALVQGFCDSIEELVKGKSADQSAA